MLGFSSKPYKLGIVLSGGGARGFAHCGALKAFEEMGIRPDAMAGVSAGSVVTAMYASGMRPDDILNVFADVKFGDLAELSVPRDGFFSMDGFKKMLRRTIRFKDIKDLPLPSLICATDLDNCRPVAFSEGDIATCVSASCSIPIVFKPVRFGGTTYVDGGVTANLPAWALRDKCKYLIGVNCSPLPRRGKPESILEIAQRTYDMLVKHNSVPQMEMCDLAISLDGIASYNVFNLKEINRICQLGYDATMDALLSAGFTRPNKPIISAGED
ncbi:MAG: patatin-like phospholipase family protein [Duncaniella sp.]|nr:patatin-like phospholipase family protein [Duncaniella sp.]MDE5735120.1 patatin-like phospholipase family protein [Duncaniella sp.]